MRHSRGRAGRCGERCGRGRWRRLRFLGRLLLPVVGLALIVLSLTGCGGRHGHGSRGWDAATVERRAVDRVDWTLDEVDATEAQRVPIRQLARELVPRFVELRKEREAARETLIAELLSGKADGEQVQGLVGAQVEAHLKLGHEVGDQLLKAHAVLTPEQREALAERWPEPEPFERPWMLDAIIERGLDRFDASDAQAELVMGHKEVLLGEVKELSAKRGRWRASLLGQWVSDKPDAEAVHAVIEEGGAAIRGLAQKATAAALELAPTLTPKQRQAILEKLGSRGR